MKNLQNKSQNLLFDKCQCTAVPPGCTQFLIRLWAPYLLKLGYYLKAIAHINGVQLHLERQF